MGLGITSDTLWLADFSPVKDGWRVCELGCGTGEISLRLARRAPMTITGVDIDPQALAIARQEAAKNQFAGQLDFQMMTITKAPQSLGRFSFDLVVCNPPFFRQGTGRSSPSATRRRAREEAAITLPAIITAAAGLLKSNGSFGCIMPPERLAEIMTLAQAARLPVTHIQPVHPKPASPAKRLLIRCGKDSRANLIVLPPITGGT